MADDLQVKRVPPLHYVHVLDQNTNAPRLEVGPLSLALQTHEKVILGPEPFVIIPPLHCCTIANPVIPSPTLSGTSFSLRLGHREVRFHQPPFPLFPGEILEKTGGVSIRPLEIIPAGQAINLLVNDDCVDENGVERLAGEKYQLMGPLTYRPRIEVSKICVVSHTLVEENHALKIEAERDLKDRQGHKRAVGDVWLMRKPGPYIPTVYEKILEVVRPYVLTDQTGIHVRSLVTHVDCFGKKRKRGEEWLITHQDGEVYIPDVTEEVFKKVDLITLDAQQYCVVENVIGPEGRNILGSKELRKGVSSFFLHPGESLARGVQKAFLLEPNQAVLLKALVQYTDMNDPAHPKGKKRIPGELWMIHGPARYFPTIEVEPVETRKAVALDVNEGIYIRNIRTGSVRALMGPQTYLLGVDEVLYEKELTPVVEQLLKKGGGDGDDDIRKVAYFSAFVDTDLLKGPRNKTKVVRYKVPPGTAVQINDHLSKTSRYIFGPELALLQPHEEFMVFSLSAGKPKRPHALKTLVLMLGPDFITDVIKVETCDHAVLNVRISYNNEFIVDPNDLENVKKIFSVPDFIGFACSVIGARIREHVAMVTFDQFHRNSNSIIEEAVFHRDRKGNMREKLYLDANCMYISNVDVHSIEPADPNMLASLTKSVAMAIEISTRSIETHAKHEAAYEKQRALGALELQKLSDDCQVEKSRGNYLEIVAQNNAVESGGTAIAEARARAEKTIIEGEAEVRLANLNAQAKEIEVFSELEILNERRNAELEYQKALTELEIQKARDQADLEVDKLGKMLASLKPETLVAIAQAGPKMQAKLLQSLGIQSTLITSGNSPINLFNTAKGLITQPDAPSAH